MKKAYLFIVLTLVPFLAMCSGPYGRTMGGWDRDGNYGCSLGFGYGGMFMWILFLIVLAVVIYFIVQNIKKNVNGQATESPIDIIKKRYAKGEITKEEFDRMKNELQ
jgi:putative membrane protein